MSSISISCKCITYGRTHLLEEAVESFLRQKYDGPKELVIVNDLPGQTLKYNHPEINIINVKSTFSTIGEKENYALNICKYPNIAVWDDDDIALPNHLSNINKYFPGNDLLHWQNGAIIYGNKLKDLTSLGNSGIVYTKDIWERSGKHVKESYGYDMTFVKKIKHRFNAKVINANPPNEEVSWFYMWGGRTYHLSGSGREVEGRPNIIERHKKFVQDNYINTGIVKLGEYTLNPHWDRDYIKMLETFNKNL